MCVSCVCVPLYDLEVRGPPVPGGQSLPVSRVCMRECVRVCVFLYDLEGVSLVALVSWLGI